MVWFTEDHVLKVAKDMQEVDATMCDALDLHAPTWADLSEEGQSKWIERATADLLATVPIDITRLLMTRSGLAVHSARLDDDGLRIIAAVKEWGREASWNIDGRSGGEEDPDDLVYPEGS